MKYDPKVLGSYALAAALPIALNYSPELLRDFSLDPETQSALSHAPWFAMLLVGFLGWRLNQTRILFSAALVLAQLYLLRRPAASILGLRGQDLLHASAISLPFSFCLIYAFKEAPLFSRRSLLRLILALLPAFLVAGLAGSDHAAFQSLWSWTAFAPGFLRTPHAALAGFIAYIALALLSKDPKVKPFMLALAFALLPLMLALESGMEPVQPRLHPDAQQTVVVLAFVCASGILLWAIFSMYWHRVYLDELTGIPNRRALDEKLMALDDGYSLAMVDIDHFKKFNDSYGHEEGDNVLRLVARHLADGSGGRAFRYGGEEFCLVFEGWTPEKAAEHCDGIRESLAGREFSIRLPGAIRKRTSAGDRGTLHAKSAQVRITISIGVAAPDKRFPYPHEVLKQADQGLYQAKEKGRNCVIHKK